MSNLLGESSLKSVESGFANFKTGSDGKKDGAVKEQASAISETNWKFVLVGKVTKRGEVELPDGSYDKLEKLETTVGNRTSSLKSNESGFANFETRAVCIKNHAALEPFKEQASAKSETNWVFDLIVKLKKIEEHIHKELLSEYHNKLEKLKEFIRVLEKLEHELKAEHKENEKLWKGLESEFSSVMTLCDQLNENLEHLHDAATEDERLLFDNELYDTDSSDSSDTSSFVIMLNRELKVFDMVHFLFHALEKLDELCSRLVSSETTVGNSDKGLQKLDIENEKVDYNENKVPSRTFRGKRMSTPIEDKGDKGLQKLDIENVKVDYNENKVPSRTFKGKRMSTPIEDKDINVIDIKSCDVLAQQLELARTSQNPVVMLFYSKCIKTRRGYYLPKFDDLPNQYRHLDGDIKFFRVRVKRAATDFKVKAYPTVLVLMPGSCGLQVVGRLSIEETIIIPAFVKALKTLLDKCLKGVLPV